MSEVDIRGTDLEVADEGQKAAGVPDGGLQRLGVRQLSYQLRRKARTQLQGNNRIDTLSCSKHPQMVINNRCRVPLAL